MPSPIMPGSPASASAKLRSVNQTKMSKAVSGKILTSKRGGQVWELALTFPLMRKDQFAPLQVFLESQEGRHGIFYVRMDQPAGAGQIIGNFCTFDTSEKLYRIIQTNPSLETFPGKPASYTAVETTDVYMRSSLKRDVQEIDWQKNGLFRFEVDVVERV